MLSDSTVTETDLKNQAAQVGLMLFGVRHRIVVPGMQEKLDVGKMLCELVLRGIGLLESGKVETSEDASLVEAFSGLVVRNSGWRPKVMADIEQATGTREILERISAGQSVEDAEVDRCLGFLKNLYEAL